MKVLISPFADSYELFEKNKSLYLLLVVFTLWLTHFVYIGHCSNFIGVMTIVRIHYQLFTIYLRTRWKEKEREYLKHLKTYVVWLTVCCKLRDSRRDIYSYRWLLLVLYLLPGARGYQRSHLLASCIVRDASDRVRIPGSTLILCSV